MDVKTRLRGRYTIIKDYDSHAIMCVYCIENTVNGKCYIGATQQKMMFRVNQHFKDLRNNYHFSSTLQADYNKIGESLFRMSILYRDAICKERLYALEGLYSELYNSYNDEYGYNRQIPGTNPKATDITISLMKGRWTDEVRMEKGRKNKERHLITPIKPPTVTPEMRAAITAKMKERYKNGVPHLIRIKSEEERKKISIALKGISAGYKNPAAKHILAYDIGSQKQYQFRTVKEAAEHFNINTCTIERIIKGRPTRTGLNFKHA